MEASSATFREIAVPVSIFTSLREELSKEAGPLPTIHALHHAGYQAGEHAASSLGSADALHAMGQGAFWSRLGEYFARRGWGTLKLGSQHSGVALLDAVDWVEAEAVATNPEASCCFSTGFLSGMLSTLASAPVAVLEVRCRARGDAKCVFAFGSEQAIHTLYGKLLDGVELEAALAEL